MHKRIFDILVSLFGIVCLAPLLLLIALAVKLDSKGSVLYQGVRTGLRGKPFHIFKFRTMVEGAEKLGGGTTALEDSRITTLGVLLRKYKLDELPQLFNVLLGQMSIVGPRPELPLYTEQYDQEEQLILSVRPGITDPSSLEFIALDEIVGRENADRVFETEVLPKKNRLRLQYVRDQSFVGDLKLIFLTLRKLAMKLS